MTTPPPAMTFGALLLLYALGTAPGLSEAGPSEYVLIDITKAAVAGTNAFDRAKYPRDNGLNNWGDVCGLCSPGTNEIGAVGASRPFFFFKSRRTVTNLGEIDGDEGFEIDESVSAYAVNDSGWVVGGSGSFSYSRPFLWIDDDLDGARDEGETHELALNDDNYRSSAQAVNNEGYVLIGGDSSLCRARFEYTAGVLQEVGNRTVLAEAYASSFALNERGDACWTVSGSGFSDGYRWIDRNTNNVAETSEITVITSPWGGARATATGINDAGHVIGSAQRGDGRKRGFLWIDANTNDVAEASEMADLTDDYQTSYIYPKDINNQDRIVGDVAQGSDRFAFVWDPERGLRDLNTLFAHTDAALGDFWARLAYQVNEFGQIALEGDYETTGNDDYAALLTPTPWIQSFRRGGDGLLMTVARQSPAMTVTVERCGMPLSTGDWDAAGGWVTEGRTNEWTEAVPSTGASFYRVGADDYPAARQ